jgi:DNA-damage-inducible protein D
MTNLKLFETASIRSFYNEENEKWYFSIVDVVEVLTNSLNPTDYLKKLRKRDTELGIFLGTNCPQIAMVNKSGIKRKTLAGTNQDLLRLIQSIPSPKAEPFKQWLAQVGAERIAEIENPELAQARIRATYKAKGYSDEWIDKRIRGILVRDELTNEWKQRDVKEGKEYAILTAEISKATFGIIPSEYKKLKGLTKVTENLRDHMTDLELIFTMLGEASTTEIAKNKNAKGFVENHKAAKAGGNVAGNARKELEKKSGKKIMTEANFKQLTENPKNKKLE